MNLLLMLLLPTVSFASSLVYVRVFYKANGEFMSKYIRSDRNAPVVSPEWAIGSCDIQAVDFIESELRGKRRRVRTDCTFYESAESQDDKANRERKEAIQALSNDVKADPVSHAKLRELVLALIEYLGLE